MQQEKANLGSNQQWHSKQNTPLDWPIALRPNISQHLSNQLPSTYMHSTDRLKCFMRVWDRGSNKASDFLDDRIKGEMRNGRRCLQAVNKCNRVRITINNATRLVVNKAESAGAKYLGDRKTLCLILLLQPFFEFAVILDTNGKNCSLPWIFSKWSPSSCSLFQYAK